MAWKLTCLLTIHVSKDYKGTFLRTNIRDYCYIYKNMFTGRSISALWCFFTTSLVFSRTSYVNSRGDAQKIILKNAHLFLVYFGDLLCSHKNFLLTSSCYSAIVLLGSNAAHKAAEWQICLKPTQSLVFSSTVCFCI